MNIVQRLKKIIAGSNEQKDNGLYFYIRVYKISGRPSADDEIVQIRINVMNDISSDDEQRFVRKVVVGPKTFRRAEFLVYLDRNNRPGKQEIENGEFVSKEVYEAYLAQQS